jgi:hypothetical protein
MPRLLVLELAKLVAPRLAFVVFHLEVFEHGWQIVLPLLVPLLAKRDVAFGVLGPPICSIIELTRVVAQVEVVCRVGWVMMLGSDVSLLKPLVIQRTWV